MVSAATQVAITVAKWVFRFGFILASIVAFLVVLTLAFSFVFITLNGNVLTDLFLFVQMWLPFNLNVLLSWLITISLIYVTYRISVIVILYIDKLLRD